MMPRRFTGEALVCGSGDPFESGVCLRKADIENLDIRDLAVAKFQIVGFAIPPSEQGRQDDIPVIADDRRIGLRIGRTVFADLHSTSRRVVFVAPIGHDRIDPDHGSVRSRLDDLEVPQDVLDPVNLALAKIEVPFRFVSADVTDEARIVGFGRKSCGFGLQPAELASQFGLFPCRAQENRALCYSFLHSNVP